LGRVFRDINYVEILSVDIEVHQPGNIYLLKQEIDSSATAAVASPEKKLIKIWYNGRDHYDVYKEQDLIVKRNFGKKSNSESKERKITKTKETSSIKKDSTQNFIIKEYNEAYSNLLKTKKNKKLSKKDLILFRREIAKIRMIKLSEAIGSLRASDLYNIQEPDKRLNREVLRVLKYILNQNLFDLRFLRDFEKTKDTFRNVIMFIRNITKDYENLFSITSSDHRSLWRDLRFMYKFILGEYVGIPEYKPYNLTDMEIEAIVKEDFPILLEILRITPIPTSSQHIPLQYKSPFCLPNISIIVNYKREEEAIAKILEYLTNVETIDHQTLSGKRTLFRILQVIGEYSSPKNITDATKRLLTPAQTPNWQALINLRNKLAHNEWDIVTNHMDTVLLDGIDTERKRQINGYMADIKSDLINLRQTFIILKQQHANILDKKSHYLPRKEFKSTVEKPKLYDVKYLKDQGYHNLSAVLAFLGALGISQIDQYKLYQVFFEFNTQTDGSYDKDKEKQFSKQLIVEMAKKYPNIQFFCYEIVPAKLSKPILQFIVKSNIPLTERNLFIDIVNKGNFDVISPAIISAAKDLENKYGNTILPKGKTWDDLIIPQSYRLKDRIWEGAVKEITVLREKYIQEVESERDKYIATEPKDPEIKLKFVGINDLLEDLQVIQDPGRELNKVVKQSQIRLIEKVLKVIKEIDKIKKSLCPQPTMSDFKYDNFGRVIDTSFGRRTTIGEVYNIGREINISEEIIAKVLSRKTDINGTQTISATGDENSSEEDRLINTIALWPFLKPLRSKPEKRFELEYLIGYLGPIVKVIEVFQQHSKLRKYVKTIRNIEEHGNTHIEMLINNDRKILHNINIVIDEMWPCMKEI